MKLDYIEQPNTDQEQIVRLYDIDLTQAIQFRNLIQQIILIEQKQLDLGTIDFIQPQNCSLTLRISKEDIGITTSDKKNFFCDLTLNRYENMTEFLEPFCIENTSGYQWLYDIDTPIEFLFSPGGTW